MMIASSYIKEDGILKLPDHSDDLPMVCDWILSSPIDELQSHIKQVSFFLHHSLIPSVVSDEVYDKLVAASIPIHINGIFHMEILPSEHMLKSSSKIKVVYLQEFTEADAVSKWLKYSFKIEAFYINGTASLEDLAVLKQAKIEAESQGNSFPILHYSFPENSEYHLLSDEVLDFAVNLADNIVTLDLNTSFEQLYKQTKIILLRKADQIRSCSLALLKIVEEVANPAYLEITGIDYSQVSNLTDFSTRFTNLKILALSKCSGNVNDALSIDYPGKLSLSIRESLSDLTSFDQRVVEDFGFKINYRDKSNMVLQK
jgi:hypothetical protein